MVRPRPAVSILAWVQTTFKSYVRITQRLRHFVHKSVPCVHYVGTHTYQLKVTPALTGDEVGDKQQHIINKMLLRTRIYSCNVVP